MSLLFAQGTIVKSESIDNQSDKVEIKRTWGPPIRSSEGYICGLGRGGENEFLFYQIRQDSTIKITKLSGEISPSGLMPLRTGGMLAWATGAVSNALAHISDNGIVTPIGAFSGNNLVGDLASDGKEHWYGLTRGDLKGDKGTIFKTDAQGGVIVLYKFTGSELPVAGSVPMRGPALHSDGSVFGVAGGYDAVRQDAQMAVFRWSIEEGFKTIAVLPSGKDGGNVSDIVADAKGVYLSLPSGGKDRCGAVVRVGATGKLDPLFEWTKADGAHPGGHPTCLVTDGKGNLYGTAYAGHVAEGAPRIVYRLSNSGDFQVLMEQSKGAEPEGRLFFDISGCLFGEGMVGSDWRHRSPCIYKVSPKMDVSIVILSQKPAPLPPDP